VTYAKRRQVAFGQLFRRQYLYFCTSKAVFVLLYYLRQAPLGRLWASGSSSGVNICTFVLVKQVD
jgi:hypothetical protein